MNLLSLALIVFVVGVNLLFWAGVGAARWTAERLARGVPAPPRHRIRPEQVAVLIAAHNEELGVASTVAAAHRLVPRGNVFVVSDGSADRTVARAREAGAMVLDVNPNGGKAAALAAGIKHFALGERFEVVMLLDADTAPAEDYLDTGLPLFDAPDVVAVAGRAATVWDRADRLGVVGQILRAYRERLYVAFQTLFKYGQAARRCNAVMIVPGFASMYRARVLGSIDIAARGLAIEDFNMTFEVHAHRLGRIAFHPRAAIAYTQDPHNLRDYSKQVSRWCLGFWQTLRRHGVRRGVFGLALAAFVAELLTSSIIFVVLGPLLVLAGAGALLVHLTGIDGVIRELAIGVATAVPVWELLLSVLLIDYLLTVLVAARQRRPSYLLLGLAFLPLRCLDAWLCLCSLWRTRFARSVGTWTSPTRRAPTGLPRPALAATIPDLPWPGPTAAPPLVPASRNGSSLGRRRPSPVPRNGSAPKPRRPSPVPRNRSAPKPRRPSPVPRTSPLHINPASNPGHHPDGAGP